MEELVRDLSAFAEPVRIRLLAALEGHELGVGELCRVVQAPQSTVSRHLKALQVSGWIRRRSEGTSGWFRADPEGIDDDRRALWAAIRGAWERTHGAEEDRLRVASVLAARDGATFFSTRATEWDELRRALYGDHFLLGAVASLLPDGLRIADLGCGTGAALVELAPFAAHLVGVDREGAMLEAAGERTRDFANVELRLGGLEALPLEDGAVDAAICLLVLHHVPDLGPVFAEVRRVLAPGGRLCVVDMVAHDRHDWRHTMGHRHTGFSRSELVAVALAAGLALVRFVALSVVADASGPPLFLASFAKPR